MLAIGEFEFTIDGKNIGDGKRSVLSCSPRRGYAYGEYVYMMSIQYEHQMICTVPVWIYHLLLSN